MNFLSLVQYTPWLNLWDQKQGFSLTGERFYSFGDLGAGYGICRKCPGCLKRGQKEVQASEDKKALESDLMKCGILRRSDCFSWGICVPCSSDVVSFCNDQSVISGHTSTEMEWGDEKNILSQKILQGEAIPKCDFHFPGKFRALLEYFVQDPFS